MSVWGKLAGAAGLVRGGAIGPAEDGPAESEVAFTVGVIALGAKMAKADGVVTVDEVNAFKEVFKIPEGEMQNVARVFNLAKQDATGYEVYADQIAALLQNDKKLRQDVLEGLMHVATADGVMHPKEDEFLRDVANRFGFTESEYRFFRARFVVDNDNPYDVLKLSPDASTEEIKAQYRKLVTDNHPDRLMGRGVPGEFVDIATRKLAAINAAYDVIAKERGL